MAIKDPSSDSIMAVLRAQMRDHPARLAFALLLFMAAALLMQSADIVESGVPTVTSTQFDSPGPTLPVPACFPSTKLPGVRDAKTTLLAQTGAYDGLPLTQLQMACFSENPKTSFLFR